MSQLLFHEFISDNVYYALVLIEKGLIFWKGYRNF
jgi:hypothetical protein